MDNPADPPTNEPPQTSGADRPERRGRRLLGVFVVLLLVALVGGLTYGAYLWGLQQDSGGVVDATGAGTEATSDPYPEELAPLIETFEELTEGAVDAPDADELLDAAIDGMLEELDDPYAEFYEPAEYATFSESLDGTYSGVGMELQETPDGLFIVTVFEGSPAQEAGLRSGDQIVEVEGEDVRDAPINSVVDEVRGDEGTEVSIGVERNGEELHFDVGRAEIEIPLLDAELLDDGQGYVELNQFTSGAGDTVREAVNGLLDDGADGLVLDLRGNPGGLLNEAVEVASVFVDEGPVVTVEASDEAETFEASGDAVDAPLVVLVDGGSASASEIVAGAIQDAGRGQLVGEPTFGKGTVQAIRSLSDGSGLKFTNAQYFTPSGESIEEIGVQPDRLVEVDEDEAAEAENGPDEQLDAAQEELRQIIAGAN
ncbi:S41 family peptidase [Egibacter rhizosphaerae]|uniref:S41 family peptidase n=1 Tax=Egibacter rhizosphaerae TaxID=1670831 RepID=A0A411YC62_9ACTN|nr:S41 family peptidase [Egibacter rhizosphaerae]QBI18776.1 S41 family peptidase [Egibacter rhizosphaerae]